MYLTSSLRVNISCASFNFLSVYIYFWVTRRSRLNARWGLFVDMDPHEHIYSLLLHFLANSVLVFILHSLYISTYRRAQNKMTTLWSRYMVIKFKYIKLILVLHLNTFYLYYLLYYKKNFFRQYCCTVYNKVIFVDFYKSLGAIEKLPMLSRSVGEIWIIKYVWLMISFNAGYVYV